MFKPRVPFDPLHIVCEICAFQFVFYAAFTLVLLVLDYFGDYPFSSQQLFNGSIYGLGKYNRRSLLGDLIANICCGISFAFVEGRSKKALDYMTTVFGIHILVSTVFSGFPTCFSFWFFSIVFWCTGTLIAEFLSMKLELRGINLDEAFNKV